MNWFLRMQVLRTPWLVGWLALALVLAPALGRMHEVLHALGLSTQQVQAADLVHDHGVAAWLAGHDALDCLVFDQLGQGDRYEPPLSLLPQVQAAQPPVWRCDGHLLPVVSRIFLTRAPPEASWSEQALSSLLFLKNELSTLAT